MIEENETLSLNQMFVIHEFPHAETQIKEIQYCLGLNEQDLQAMTPKEKNYVKSIVDRHTLFFKGQSHITVARTPSRLFNKDQVIKTEDAATAYHQADWRSFIAAYNAKLKLPSTLVCFEYLTEGFFPITDKYGKVVSKIRGAVIFARQIKYKDRAAILIDFVSLSYKRNKLNDQEMLVPYTPNAIFMLTTDEDNNCICLVSSKKNIDWTLFVANTAENMILLQVAILIILFKIKKESICHPRRYKI
jgi:hypothetical protein